MSRRFSPWPWLLALAALVLSAVLTLALLARDLGAERVVRTLNGNTTAISNALRVPFERATAVGIPLSELVGVAPLLADHLKRHHEVAFFALLDAQRATLVFQASPLLTPADAAQAREQADLARDGRDLAGDRFRTVRTPLHAADEAAPQGWLLTGYPIDYIDHQVNAVVLDLFVAVLIAVILTLEVLRFASTRPGWGLWLQFGAFLRGVQQGSLSLRSPLTGTDGLARLGQAMNQRIEHLRHRLIARLSPPAPTEAAAGPAHGHDPAMGTLRAWGRAHGLLDAAPTRTDTQGLSALRLGVFLTVLSDELVRPFMAVLASQLQGPLTLSVETLAGIPLSTFLLTWALSQPFGAALLRQHGSRRCLSVATAVVGVSLVATAWVSDWFALTALRGITGAAFGFVLIFSQTLMLRLGQASGRAGAIAEFVGAVVAAGICGPVIGGLMSVKLGTGATLVAAGLCALAAFALALGQAAIPPPQAGRSAATWANLAALVRHRPLMGLLLCSAIPGKLAATAVLLLVIPLAVADLGESASVTGRLLLLYFLAFFLVSKGAGRLSDRRGTRKPFVVMGGLLSALGCGVGLTVDGVWGLVGLSFLLGLGQAWLSSPQIVWATQMADQRQGQTPTDAELVLGIYRLVERFGGGLGPLLVAALVASQGLRPTLALLAAVLVLGSLAVLWGLRDARPDVRPGQAPDSVRKVVQ